MRKYSKVLMFITILLGIFPNMFYFFNSNNTEAEELKKIIMAYVVSENTMLGKHLSLIYTEAFRRLDLEFVYEYYPAKRASLLADTGKVDGEVARIYTYANAHPNLIRCEEPLLSVRFVATAIDPLIRLNGWESLRGKNYKVEYMRGVRKFEEKLPSLIKKENLSEVSDWSSGLRKLISGRTDIYLDAENTLLKPLKSDEFKNSGIRIVGVLEEVPIYPYLHKKHRSLVPKLAKVLKELKREGLIEQYEEIAEKK